MTARRIPRKQTRDPLRFMEAVVGHSAHRVAVALSSLTPGIDWRGSTKGTMAEHWAKRKPGWPYGALIRVELEDITSALAYPLPSIQALRVDAMKALGVSYRRGTEEDKARIEAFIIERLPGVSRAWIVRALNTP